MKIKFKKWSTLKWFKYYLQCIYDLTTCWLTYDLHTFLHPLISFKRSSGFVIWTDYVSIQTHIGKANTRLYLIILKEKKNKTILLANVCLQLHFRINHLLLLFYLFFLSIKKILLFLLINLTKNAFFLNTTVISKKIISRYLKNRSRQGKLKNKFKFKYNQTVQFLN